MMRPIAKNSSHPPSSSASCAWRRRKVIPIAGKNLPRFRRLHAVPLHRRRRRQRRARPGHHRHHRAARLPRRTSHPPDQIIKDGYIALEVITNDGDSFTGIRLRETATDLVLRDATHDEIIIPKSTIKKQRSIGTLMPTGLTDGLTDNELADLVRFLTELGKPGPFDVGHAPVSRQWLTLTTLPPTLNLPDANSLGHALATDARLAWARAFSEVAGEVPLSEVAIGPDATTAVLRCRLNVTAAGKVGVRLNNEQGVRVWLDAQPISPAALADLDLSATFHVLDFVIDTASRKSPQLRCELVDMANSTARLQWAPTR